MKLNKKEIFKKNLIINLNKIEIYPIMYEKIKNSLTF